jgi:hypothetical protein
MRPAQTRYLTTRGFVDYIRTTTGIPLTKSRFQKDRMHRPKEGPLAPQPVARFGNRDLFTEAQAPEYISKLIKVMKADPQTIPVSDTPAENRGQIDSLVASGLASEGLGRPRRTVQRKTRDAGSRVGRRHDP